MSCRHLDLSMADNTVPAFYKKIDCHMVFDIKIRDLMHMAWGLPNGSSKGLNILEHCVSKSQREDCIPCCSSQ